MHARPHTTAPPSPRSFSATWYTILVIPITFTTTIRRCSTLSYHLLTFNNAVGHFDTGAFNTPTPAYTPFISSDNQPNDIHNPLICLHRRVHQLTLNILICLLNQIGLRNINLQLRGGFYHTRLGTAPPTLIHQVTFALLSLSLTHIKR